MTWTYGNSPSTTGGPGGSYNIDLLRFIIGDTDTNHQLLQDEELDFIISTQSNYYMGAAIAAEALTAKFAPSTQEKLGDWSQDFQQRYDHFLALSKELRRIAARGITGFFGGMPTTTDPEADHEKRFKSVQIEDLTW